MPRNARTRGCCKPGSCHGLKAGAEDTQAAKIRLADSLHHHLWLCASCLQILRFGVSALAGPSNEAEAAKSQGDESSPSSSTSPRSLRSALERRPATSWQTLRVKQKMLANPGLETEVWEQRLRQLRERGSLFLRARICGCNVQHLL